MKHKRMLRSHKKLRLAPSLIKTNTTRPNCKRIPQQGNSVVFFCLFFYFDCPVEVLACLKSCLWNPGAYRHKIVSISSAQFGPVMNFHRRFHNIVK